MFLAARLKSSLELLSYVAVIGAAGALLWTLLVGPLNTPTQPPQVEPIDGLSIDAASITHVLGKGPVAIVEFSDFQCPYCAAYARSVLPKIKQDLISSGDVRYVVMHFPLERRHSRALEAGQAAECAGQEGRFWEMHERLFSDSDGLSRESLINHARELELDQDLFEVCLADEKTVAKVRADQTEGLRLGVTGTPAFFVGSIRSDDSIELTTRINGIAPVDVFSRETAAVLSRVNASKLRKRTGSIQPASGHVRTALLAAPARTLTRLEITDGTTPNGSSTQ